MKIRGTRECKTCGTTWSYYETGSVECPDCGSIRSVGIDDRTEHTDSPASLDLSPVMERVDSDSLEVVASDAAERCGDYVRKRGFVRAGTIQPLDATFVAAVELRHVAAELARSIRVDDDEELYFLSMVRGAAAGDRPPASEVPDSLAAARGLATASIVDAYRRDLTRYLDDHPDDAARQTMGRLVDHKKRLEALDGAVPVETSETMVQALTDLSHYVVTGEESHLANARNRLDGLD